MWEDIEFDPEQIPAFKLGFHIAQIVFAFVLWCLEIAVFRNNEARIVGNNGWTFAVFFLSIPAWIYLAMTPRFPRTRKIAEPHAMLVVDALFTIIWLSAFATQAAYNTANLCGTACGISKAIVGLGFFVFLFFCVTTFFSIWTLKYYQWNNRLPGYDRTKLDSSQNIDPDKAAFSLAPHDEEAYAPVNMNDHDADHDHDTDHDTPYGGARSDYSDPYGGSGVGGGGARSDYSDPYGAAAGSQEAASPFDNDTEYHSGRVSAAGSRYAAPSAADDFEEDHSRPARFPAANYDRIER
ncbi:Chaperone-binding protein [Madurella fahalii]|uniref:Chaperone-binding protein n=1 Tax=Madurella fahalii TaxID=1157608 RepID=A0ABQ0G920_9PEZI